jgi:dinuclear metal center YbgI/SA1388 family protein
MSASLKQLTSYFEEIWPLVGAEEWDAPGLVTGSEEQLVSRVLLAVDINHEIMAEAEDGGFDLVLAHHPLLLKGVNGLSESTSKGSLVAKAIRANIALYAAHTNADIVESGVSDVLAKSLGLNALTPLVPTGKPGEGHGRVGSLDAPVTLGEFARFAAEILPSTASGVRVAGDFEQMVQRVAVCGGAGDSFIDAAIAAEVDVYLTSDLRHHPVQEARELAAMPSGGPAFIDVAHWAGEWLWLEVAAVQLSKRFDKVQFVVSQMRTDPWDFVVTQ